MNKFSLIHVAKIFYLHFSLGLYIRLMRFQIHVKWAAFKLLFSLEAWHWKKGGIPPDDRRAITGLAPFGEQSSFWENAIRGRRCWGLFEGLRLLIWWRCGVEKKEKEEMCACVCERMPVLKEVKGCL